MKEIYDAMAEKRLEERKWTDKAEHWELEDVSNAKPTDRPIYTAKYVLCNKVTLATICDL
jgi:hypothetical protein